MRSTLAFALVASLSACATTELPPSAAADLRVLDESQRLMVAAGDVKAIAALAHPNLRINAPTGRILTRDELLAMMRDGRIKAEQFDRTAEDITISGKVASVMGRETFTPTAGSELGRIYGAKPLQRRYTNMYVWDDGAWRWLSRHANVVQSTTTSQSHPTPHATACEPANGREGTLGCWVLATAPVSPQTGPVYWHVYELDSAQTVQGSEAQSSVIKAHGRTWLVTVAEQQWKPPSGRHVATVGPLQLLSTQPHVASFMEATFTPGMSSRVHTHPGPEAWVVLEGEQCLETPEGVIRGRAGDAMKVRGGIPMQLFGTGAAVRKALVLIVHPVGQPLGTPHNDWRPSGACTAE